MQDQFSRDIGRTLSRKFVAWQHLEAEESEDGRELRYTVVVAATAHSAQQFWSELASGN